MHKDGDFVKSIKLIDFIPLLIYQGDTTSGRKKYDVVMIDVAGSRQPSKPEKGDAMSRPAAGNAKNKRALRAPVQFRAGSSAADGAGCIRSRGRLRHCAPGGASAPLAESAIGEGKRGLRPAAVAASIAGPLVVRGRGKFLRGRGVRLVAHEQRLVQKLNAALRRQHHPRLHALGGRVALDDLERDLRMIVVIVGVLAEPLVRLGTHVDAGVAAIRFEARRHLARDVSRNAFYGETGRTHRLGKRALTSAGTGA